MYNYHIYSFIIINCRIIKLCLAHFVSIKEGLSSFIEYESEIDIVNFESQKLINQETLCIRYRPFTMQ